MNHNSLNAIDVVVLCGGLGTRLRRVLPGTPKILAPIGKQVFFDILFRQLTDAGFRRFVLCVGYLKEDIKRYGANFSIGGGIEIFFAEEDHPLGTGGAIANAKPYIASDRFFVLNGDSYCRVDFRRLYSYHISKDSMVTAVLGRASSRTDVGRVIIDESNRITAFQEKREPPTGSYMNAGVYVMEKKVFAQFPAHAESSLEYDIFPHVIAGMKCYGFPVEGDVIDIGTPERYRNAELSLLV